GLVTVGRRPDGRGLRPGLVPALPPRRPGRHRSRPGGGPQHRGATGQLAGRRPTRPGRLRAPRELPGRRQVARTAPVQLAKRRNRPPAVKTTMAASSDSCPLTWWRAGRTVRARSWEETAPSTCPVTTAVTLSTATNV